MTDTERFKAIADGMLLHRFEALRTLARLKALEAMVSHTVTKNALPKWETDLDKLTHQIFQNLLESFERQNPGYAASLDQRKMDELGGL